VDCRTIGENTHSRRGQLAEHWGEYQETDTADFELVAAMTETQQDLLESCVPGKT
jgi:hypothetical protein